MEKILRVFRFDVEACQRSAAILFCTFFLFGLYYGLTIGNLLVIPVSVMIWVTMIAGLPYSLRDKYGLDKLMATLPVNRKTIVRSRFLFSIVLGVLGIAMSEIMVCLAAGIFHVGFDIREMFFALELSLLLFCLILAVHMPLYFYSGSTQAIQVSPIFVYFIFIIGSQLYYTGIFDIDMGPAVSLAWRLFPLTLSGTLVLGVILLYLSYVITFRVYLNKDL